MDSVLQHGIYQKDFPQWVVQQNVLAWTGARDQGLGGSERHQAAYQCMGEGAIQALKALEGAGPMNQKNRGRLNKAQVLSNTLALQTSLDSRLNNA